MWPAGRRTQRAPPTFEIGATPGAATANSRTSWAAMPGSPARPFVLDVDVIPTPDADGDDLEGGLVPVHVDVGQFDQTPEHEIVVMTNAGIAIVPLDGAAPQVLDEAPRDLAAIDVNDDNISDLLVIGDVPVLHLSTPF